MGNSNARLTLLLPLLLVFCPTLWGQEASWFLDKRPRYIQRLAWTADEYALRYEVAIELEEGDAFREIMRESTTANYIEASLAPGKYRYRVIVYDLLDRPGPAPEWVLFEVIEALQPELLDFSPDHFDLSPGENSPGENSPGENSPGENSPGEDAVFALNLTGQNLLPDAEVYLQPEGSVVPVIVPDEYQVSAPFDTAELAFNRQQLTPGNYTVYIKNPGGLEASRGTLRIILPEPVAVESVDEPEADPEPEAEPPEIAPAPPLGPAPPLSPVLPVDFYFALDYAPLVPLYGELNRLLDQPLFPLGGQIRFGVIPIKRTFGCLGLELAAGWHYFHSSFDNYEVSFNAPGVELSLLYQKWLSNQVMAFNFRAGGGFGISGDLKKLYPGGNMFGAGVFLMPRITAGVSFLYMISQSFFAEAGLDYAHWFTADDPAPGYLRPRIGAGYRF